MAFQMMILKEEYLLIKKEGLEYRQWADYYIIRKNALYKKDRVKNVEVFLFLSMGHSSERETVKVLWKVEKENKIIGVGYRRLRKSMLSTYFNEVPPSLIEYYNNKYFHRKLKNYIYFKEA